MKRESAITVLGDDTITFSFPDIHALASLTVEFRRALRIPQPDVYHPLPYPDLPYPGPPGAERFPLRRVEDVVMLPMHRSEAMWIIFSSPEVPRFGNYRFAIKATIGETNALTGDPVCESLGVEQSKWEHLVVPFPLDGFRDATAGVRQFLATPETRPEQRRLRIEAWPMRGEVFEAYRAVGSDLSFLDDHVIAGDSVTIPGPALLLREHLRTDYFPIGDWAHDARGHCRVDLVPAQSWASITGSAPTTEPYNAALYARHGLPWFDHYGD